MDADRSRFPDRDSRLPVWRFTQEFPFDGEPPDVGTAVDGYQAYLRTDPAPKLLLTFEPGSIMDPPMIAWAEQNVADLAVQVCAEGVHFVQEDQPEEIRRKLARLRDSYASHRG